VDVEQSGISSLKPDVCGGTKNRYLEKSSTGDKRKTGATESRSKWWGGIDGTSYPDSSSYNNTNNTLQAMSYGLQSLAWI